MSESRLIVIIIYVPVIVDTNNSFPKIHREKFTCQMFIAYFNQKYKNAVIPIYVPIETLLTLLSISISEF